MRRDRTPRRAPGAGMARPAGIARARRSARWIPGTSGSGQSCSAAYARPFRIGKLPYNDCMDISDDDLRACIRVLRTIEADRAHLTRLSREQRRELLTLAGLVAKPERHDLVRMAKAFRRAEREAAKAQDRQAIEQAGLRRQRSASVFTPLWLEPPKHEDRDERPRLRQERDCYVCKQPFSKVHRYYDS